MAARGDISDAIDWTRRARDAGLDSVWIHDSYFERDAITYGSAIAGALATDPPSSFRLGLGAVNPYTRHPVVLAMTAQRFDWQLAPGEVVHPNLRITFRPSAVRLLMKERNG